MLQWIFRIVLHISISTATTNCMCFFTTVVKLCFTCSQTQHFFFVCNDIQQKQHLKQQLCLCDADCQLQLQCHTWCFLCCNQIFSNCTAHANFNSNNKSRVFLCCCSAITFCTFADAPLLCCLQWHLAEATFEAAAVSVWCRLLAATRMPHLMLPV